jgi:hypothetical protein
MPKPACSTSIPRQQAGAKSALTFIELQALQRADAQGWLALTVAIGDAALSCWQQQCQRGRKPFAILRSETTRASLWFVLPSGQAWSAMEQERIRDCLRDATGIILTANNVRAFLHLGMEDAILERLLGFTRTRKSRVVKRRRPIRLMH